MGKKKPSKKGDNKALSISHPNSRKAKALAKRIIRSTGRQKTKVDSLITRTLLVNQKFMWFKENLEPCEECSAPMLERLFEKYLSRFDEELEQIRIKHSVGQRKGRQHASREDIIVMTKKREAEEYNTCGIEMVDILNPKQFKLFKEWSGNPSVHFNLRRFNTKFLAEYKPPNQTKLEKTISPDNDREPKKEDKDVEQMIVAAN